MNNAQADKRFRITAFKPTFAATAPAPILGNTKAERGVIGAVLQKPELFPTLSHLLQPGDFWTFSLGLIWYVLDIMTANDEPIDLLTVASALEKEKSNPFKDPEQLMVELSSLYGAAAEVDNAESYARDVREAALKMRVLSAFDTLRNDIYRGDLHGEILKDEVNRRLFEATEQSVERRTDTRSMMAEFIDSFEGGANNCVSLGMKDLDALLSGHGLFAGEVCVWVGGAGMGKTTSILSIARNVSKSGHTTALFTMEMEQKEIAQALMAMETGIHRALLQSKRVSPQQWQAIVDAKDDIAKWRLHTVDMHEFPALKPLQLKRKLRSLMVNTPVDMVILDGLWLMQPDEPTPNRFEAVGAIMRDLSGVAKQFNVPILLAHQYARIGSRAKKPTLDMMAESSGVERNAQVVIGMWRNSYFDDEADTETRAYVLKNRNRGMLGAAPLPYDVRFNRYGDK
jgi:replicative DNA helicase